MASDEKLGMIREGTAALGDVIKIAGDSPEAREAGRNLGRAAVTVTRLINNALLPIAAVNYGFDKARTYFTEQFEAEMAAKTAEIPPEHVVEPKASIAGPALQGLAFAHEEQSLREMFLNLMATAMDGRVSGNAHPAFVEIIKQMNAADAVLLRLYLGKNLPAAIAELRSAEKDNGWIVVRRHLLPWSNAKTGEPIVEPLMASIVDNWIRLGLIQVDYNTISKAPNAYDWVEQRPKFQKMQAELEGTERRAEFRKGIIFATALGGQFAKAVGIGMSL